MDQGLHHRRGAFGGYCSDGNHEGVFLMATKRSAAHSEVLSGATFHRANTERGAKTQAAVYAGSGHRVKVAQHKGKWGCWTWPKKNPRKKRKNPEAAARSMHSKFVGMPSEKTIVVDEKIHTHTHLAALGELVELKVKTIAGKYKGQTFVIEFGKQNNPKGIRKKIAGWVDRRAKAVTKIAQGVQKAWINPSRKRNPNGPVTLACSEDGRNLFCMGGNQTLDLNAVGLGSVSNKESVVVGEIKVIDYFTSKLWPGKDKPEVAVYTHKFGEESGGPLPILRYSTIDKLCYIDGGSFHIPKPLLGVSQGITD